jgi:hypothetical protein
VHSTRHAAGGFSEDCCARADGKGAAIAIINAIAPAVVAARSPAHKELADMGLTPRDWA